MVGAAWWEIASTVTCPSELNINQSGQPLLTWQELHYQKLFPLCLVLVAHCHRQVVLLLLHRVKNNVGVTQQNTWTERKYFCRAVIFEKRVAKTQAQQVRMWGQDFLLSQMSVVTVSSHRWEHFIIWHNWLISTKGKGKVLEMSVCQAKCIWYKNKTISHTSMALLSLCVLTKLFSFSSGLKSEFFHHPGNIPEDHSFLIFTNKSTSCACPSWRHIPAIRGFPECPVSECCMKTEDGAQ